MAPVSLAVGVVNAEPLTAGSARQRDGGPLRGGGAGGRRQTRGWRKHHPSRPARRPCCRRPMATRARGSHHAADANAGAAAARSAVVGGLSMDQRTALALAVGSCVAGALCWHTRRCAVRTRCVAGATSCCAGSSNSCGAGWLAVAPCGHERWQRAMTPSSQQCAVRQHLGGRGVAPTLLRPSVPVTPASLSYKLAAGLAKVAKGMPRTPAAPQRAAIVHYCAARHPLPRHVYRSVQCTHAQQPPPPAVAHVDAMQGGQADDHHGHESQQSCLPHHRRQCPPRAAARACLRHGWRPRDHHWSTRTGESVATRTTWSPSALLS